MVGVSVDQQRDVDVDLDANRATISNLFDGDECRLTEDEHGWRGFARDRDGEGVVYYWVDTRYGEQWPGRLRVSEDAVERVVSRWLTDPDAVHRPHLLVGGDPA